MECVTNDHEMLILSFNARCATTAFSNVAKGFAAQFVANHIQQTVIRMKCYTATNVNAG